MITLNNMKPNRKQTCETKEQSLKKCIEGKDGAEHISYDHDTFAWTFKVPHFTKWGAEDDDDDEVEMSDEQSQVVSDSQLIPIEDQTKLGRPIEMKKETQAIS